MSPRIGISTAAIILALTTATSSQAWATPQYYPAMPAGWRPDPTASSTPPAASPVLLTPTPAPLDNTIQPSGTLSLAGTLNINAGATFTNTSPINLSGNIANSGSGNLSTSPTTGGTILIGAGANLTINGPQGGVLHLVGSQLIVLSGNAAFTTGGASSIITVSGNPTFGNVTIAPTTGDPGTLTLHIGDVNNDGTIDIKDLQTLADHWQQPITDWSANDGTIDPSLLQAVANQWQTGVGSSQSASLQAALVASVPEPASLTLLAASALLVMRRRAR